MAENKEEITKGHCNQCGGETKHFVVAQRSKPGREDLDDEGDSWIEWNTTWEMLECCGCETIKLRKSFWFSEDDGTRIEYFPPAVARELPGWNSALSEDMASLLIEVYAALNADSRRLAVMGARTLIDMVILDTVGDVGTFKDKMSALEAQGVVSSKNREFLEAALEAGNAAAHRGHAAKSHEVNHVMDIVENLLQAVYALPKATSALKATTPPRPPRPATNPAPNPASAAGAATINAPPAK